MKNNLKQTVAVLGVSLLAMAALAQNDNNNSATSTSMPMDQTTVNPQHFVWEAGKTDIKEVHLSELALQKSDNPNVKTFAEHMIASHQKNCKKLQGIAESEGLKFPDTNSVDANDDWRANGGGNSEMGTNGDVTALPETPRGQGATTNPVVANTSDANANDGSNTMAEVPRGQGSVTNPVVATGTDSNSTANLSNGGNPQNLRGQDSESNSMTAIAADYQNGTNGMPGHWNLEQLSGAQFDQAYVAKMIKEHKMAIHKFEAADAQLQDPELKKFVEKTLPTLRSHLRMAEDLQTKIGSNSGAVNMDTNMVDRNQ